AFSSFMRRHVAPAPRVASNSFPVLARPRQRCNRDVLKPRDVVVFRPERDLAIREQTLIPRSQDDLAIERDGELIVLGDDSKALPAIARHLCVDTGDTPRLAVHDT